MKYFFRFIVAFPVGFGISACGVNGLTVENPPTAPFHTLPELGPLLRLNFTFLAKDENGQALDFTSIHWTQYATNVQAIGGGFQFTSQALYDDSNIRASLFFNTLETCPIEIYASLFPYSDQKSNPQRGIYVETTAYNRKANRIAFNKFDSRNTEPQTFEACGTLFAVQFQIVELGH